MLHRHLLQAPGQAGQADARVGGDGGHVSSRTEHVAHVHIAGSGGLLDQLAGGERGGSPKLGQEAGHNEWGLLEKLVLAGQELGTSVSATNVAWSRVSIHPCESIIYSLPGIRLLAKPPR